MSIGPGAARVQFVAIFLTIRWNHRRSRLNINPAYTYPKAPEANKTSYLCSNSGDAYGTQHIDRTIDWRQLGNSIRERFLELEVIRVTCGCVIEDGPSVCG